MALAISSHMADTRPANPPSKDCRTCNRRRIRCDRTFPSCRKCASRNLECPGFALNLKWQEGASRKRRRKVTVLPIIDDCPRSTSLESAKNDPSPPGLSLQLANSETAITLHEFGSAVIQPAQPDCLQDTKTRELLHHYTKILAPQLAWVENLENPWRKLILPLAIEFPPVLHSVLAMAAGDLTERHFSIPKPLDEDLLGYTRHHSKALEHLTRYVKYQVQQDRATENDFGQGPSNSILATISILCFHETRWPSNGLWKVHLRGALEIIRRWASLDLPPNITDPARNFLLQEIFAINTMASITAFKSNEGMVKVSIPINEKSPFIGFVHVTHTITELRRNPHLQYSINDISMRLEQSRQHALSSGRLLHFTSTQSRVDFGHVVNTFYYTNLIYAFRALLSRAKSDLQTIIPVNKLFQNLRKLTNAPLFAQDMAWQLFIAGTECRGSVQEQKFVERAIIEIARVSGAADRLRSLEFLKEFWYKQEQGSEESWILMAQKWAQEGNPFLIW
ncbi:hypothetical protein IFR05_009165 [Cadophora sp. M221]|nr:hypothetical protein IFR05_009165 [Cadophora sp. M221]